MTSRTHRYWRQALIAVAVLAFGLSIGRAFTRPGLPPIGDSEALIQHAGWYVTQGAVPYVHIWDIKPPLTLELATVLALLSGGDMYVLHVLSVLVSAAVGIGCIYLVGVLTYELTSNEMASLFAGLTLISFAGFHWGAAIGFQPKYFAIFFGLLAVMLQLRGMPIYSGAAAAASGGFIQHGAVFSILVLGLATINRDSWHRVRHTLIGMAIVTGAVVLPIVLMGAFEAMVVEVVLVQLTVSDPKGPLWFLFILKKGVLTLGFAALPVAAGTFGLLRIGLSDLKRLWWVVVGAAMYGFQVFYIDFDGPADLFFALVFVAFGVGLLINDVGRRNGRVISAVVALIVVISIVGSGGFGVVTSPVHSENENTLLYTSVESLQSGLGLEGREGRSNNAATDTPSGDSNMTRIYWNKVKPESCHYRLSGTELDWIEQSNRSVDAETCGQFP